MVEIDENVKSTDSWTGFGVRVDPAAAEAACAKGDISGDDATSKAACENTNGVDSSYTRYS